MTSNDPLPAPSRALWITFAVAALFPVAGAVAYFSTRPGEHGAALVVALAPTPILVVYLLSLRSIRALQRRVLIADPGALVFPVAHTDDLRLAIELLPGAKTALIVQYVGVSANENGVKLWTNGRREPVAVVPWSEVSAVTVGGSPVDHAHGVRFVEPARRAGWASLGQLRVAAIQVHLVHGGKALSLPLAVYSARSGYPASRPDFAIIATTFLWLRGTGG